jgi:AcrR family transcriptional regulator
MSSVSKYHHGDLHAALLREAHVLLHEEGIEGLSLRKLAERVGVSRTAPYHHFRDKHELLCALATDGFRSLEHMMTLSPLQPGETLAAELREFVMAYLRFATEHPHQYDLMFGRPIWKSGRPTDELKAVAYGAFRRYADNIGALVDKGQVRGTHNPLRFAQASWATLHGLCRLLLDGIYVNRADMEEMSEEAVQIMLSLVNRQV